MLTIDANHLTTWLVEQRWFASKQRELSAVNLLEVQNLRDGDPPLTLALVEARFSAGTHELYQLLLTGREDPAPARGAGRGAAAGTAPGDDEEGAIASAHGWTLYDALEEPALARELTFLLQQGATVEGERGTISFNWVQGAVALGLEPEVRPVGVEQSNTSLVLDERLVLKVFRRLEPGDNPELEMLRFLTAHEFDHIAALAGWYAYSGELMDATLGVVQEYVAGATDGWELVVGALVRGGEDPELLDQLRELGEVTGELHRVLGSATADPDFAPEDPGDESLSLITATIDEEIERLFFDLPPDDESLAPIAGRGEEIRDRLQLMSHVGVGGRLIRHHGDFHLGQTLRAAGRWVLLDFEGEPARSMRERRRKRSPLRDVAGMLRSFAYAASASELLHGVAAPEDWEQRAREAFLGGYFATVDGGLLPTGQAGIERLLAIFELEKAVYELRYELNNRPDWVGIPVAGIARLLEAPLPT
jgi:maltokinase